MKEKIEERVENSKKYIADKNSKTGCVFFILVVFISFLADIPAINSKIIFYLCILMAIPYILGTLISFFSEEKEQLNNLKISLNYLLPKFLALAIIMGIIYLVILPLYTKSYPKPFQQSYVYAFPNADYAKNYRVKADLEFDSEDGYQVSKIYFDNGGYIEFNSCVDGYEKGDMFFCEANNDEKEWGFRYYEEKIPNKKSKK